MVPPPWRQIQLSGGRRCTLHVFGGAAEEPALSDAMPIGSSLLRQKSIERCIRNPLADLEMFKDRATIANPFVRFETDDGLCHLNSHSRVFPMCRFLSRPLLKRRSVVMSINTLVQSFCLQHTAQIHCALEGDIISVVQECNTAKFCHAPSKLQTQSEHHTMSVQVAQRRFVSVLKSTAPWLPQLPERIFETGMTAATLDRHFSSFS